MKVPQMRSLVPGRCTCALKCEALSSQREAFVPQSEAFVPQKKALLPQNEAHIPERGNCASEWST